MEFDTWLQNCIEFDSKPCNYRIRQGIDSSKRKKLVDDRKIKTLEVLAKSNFLLVPNRMNLDVNIIV